MSSSIVQNSYVDSLPSATHGLKQATRRTLLRTTLLPVYLNVHSILQLVCKTTIAGHEAATDIDEGL